jgi:uncharacterized protein YutE (UPF0331/DUF86 family)
VVDEQVLLAKVSQVRRHLRRVRDRLPPGEKTFLDDEDLQDVVVHNLWLALQSCIDIAAHVVADEGLGQPSGLADLFDLLGEHQIISSDLARQLRKAAGLRNIIVHEYVRLDLAMIYRIAKGDLTDLDALLLAITDHFNLGSNA